MTDQKKRRAASAPVQEAARMSDGMRHLVILLVGGGLVAALWTAGSYWNDKPGLTLKAPARMAAAPESDGVAQLMERLKANPGDVEALSALAQHFNHLGDAERAEMFALRAVMSAPTQAPPLHLLGLIQHTQGRNAEAAASLEKSLQLGDDPSVRYSLGMLYLHYLNERGKGEEHLKKIVATSSAPAELKARAAESLKTF